MDEKRLQKSNRIKRIIRARSLCQRKIDIYSFITYHPSESLEKDLRRCQTRFVPFEEDFINKIVQKYPYYMKGTIPTDFYKVENNKEPILSFGGIGLILVNADMDEKLAYNITKAVLENLDTWKKISPTYSTLTRELMAQRGFKPEKIHAGAMRYYREVGLQK